MSHATICQFKDSSYKEIDERKPTSQPERIAKRKAFCQKQRHRDRQALLDDYRRTLPDAPNPPTFWYVIPAGAVTRAD